MDFLERSGLSDLDASCASVHTLEKKSCEWRKVSAVTFGDDIPWLRAIGEGGSSKAFSEASSGWRRPTNGMWKVWA